MIFTFIHKLIYISSSSSSYMLFHKHNNITTFMINKLNYIHKFFFSIFDWHLFHSCMLHTACHIYWLEKSETEKVWKKRREKFMACQQCSSFKIMSRPAWKERRKIYVNSNFFFRLRRIMINFYSYLEYMLNGKASVTSKKFRTICHFYSLFKNISWLFL